MLVMRGSRIQFQIWTEVSRRSVINRPKNGKHVEYVADSNQAVAVQVPKIGNTPITGFVVTRPIVNRGQRLVIRGSRVCAAAEKTTPVIGCRQWIVVCRAMAYVQPEAYSHSPLSKVLSG